VVSKKRSEQEQSHVPYLPCSGLFELQRDDLVPVRLLAVEAFHFDSAQAAGKANGHPERHQRNDTGPRLLAATHRSLAVAQPAFSRVWKKDRYSVGGKVTIVNAMNKAALYNFIFSFSGTHFVTPRTIEGEIAFHF
jgi:hypothetical protein